MSRKEPQGKPLFALVPRRKAVVFAVERWATYYPDAIPLWPLHWQEVALTQAEVPLDMDVERYAALDEAGILHIVTGRDAGRLIAYHTSLISLIYTIKHLACPHGSLLCPSLVARAPRPSSSLVPPTAA